MGQALAGYVKKQIAQKADESRLLKKKSFLKLYLLLYIINRPLFFWVTVLPAGQNPLWYILHTCKCFQRRWWMAHMLPLFRASNRHISKSKRQGSQWEEVTKATDQSCTLNPQLGRHRSQHKDSTLRILNNTEEQTNIHYTPTLVWKDPPAQYRP